MRTSIKFTPSIKPGSDTWERITDVSWFTSDFKHGRVRVASLIGTQSSVTRGGMKIIATDWRRPILVVRIAGKSYIRDGHHRVTRAKYLGQQTIAALILELK